MEAAKGARTQHEFPSPPGECERSSWLGRPRPGLRGRPRPGGGKSRRPGRRRRRSWRSRSGCRSRCLDRRADGRGGAGRGRLLLVGHGLAWEEGWGPAAESSLRSLAERGGRSPVPGGGRTAASGAGKALPARGAGAAGAQKGIGGGAMAPVGGAPRGGAFLGPVPVWVNGISGLGKWELPWTCKR